MAQINKNSQNAAPKTFDVVAPGKTPSPPSGKPIIVSNRPIIKDPMAPNPLKSVSGALHPGAHTGPSLTSTMLIPSSGPNGNAEQSPGAVRLPGRRMMKTIAVLSNTPDTAAQADSAPAEAAADEANLPSTPQPPEASPQQEAPKPEAAATAADKTEPKDEPAVEAPLGRAGSAPSTDVPLADNARQRAEQAQAARLAEEEKTIASKQYYLPIKDVAQQRGNNRAALWLVLALLAALIWLDVVLDAGVVHVGGLHALTHFFGT